MQLRLVRRGAKVYALATEEGKSERIIASFTVGDPPTMKFSTVGRSATDTSELDAIVRKMSIKVVD